MFTSGGTESDNIAIKGVAMGRRPAGIVMVPSPNAVSLSDFAATGSGSLHAGTVVKLGFRPSLDRSDAVELVINSLFQAADEDSATGGPDLVRGI